MGYLAAGTESMPPHVNTLVLTPATCLAARFSIALARIISGPASLNPPFNFFLWKVISRGAKSLPGRNDLETKIANAARFTLLLPGTFRFLFSGNTFNAFPSFYLTRVCLGFTAITTVLQEIFVLNEGESSQLSTSSISM